MNIRKWLFVIFLFGFVLGCGNSLPETLPDLIASPSNTPTVELLPAEHPSSTPTLLSPTAVVPTAVIPTTVVPSAAQEQAKPNTNSQCQKPSEWIEYSIQPGDTLTSLAQRTNSSVDTIKAVSCLTREVLFIGQKLFLPTEPAVRSTMVATSELPPPAPPPPPPTRSTSNMTPIPTATTEIIPPTTATATWTPSPTATSEIIPPEGPGDPRLTIIPPQGLPGTAFTFVIEEFGPYEVVIFRVRTAALAVVYQVSITVDENGYGQVTYESPLDAQSGIYVARALGTLSVASGNFRILASQESTPSPTHTSLPAFTPTVIASPMPTFTPTDIPGPKPGLTPTVITSPMPAFTPTDIPGPKPAFTPTVIASPMPAFTPTGIPGPKPAFTPTAIPSPAPAPTG